MTTDLSGTNIGPYRVVERLGSGGMADVYKAYQPQLDRYVAIKFIRPELALHQDFRTRFENEAKAIAKLSHGNIVHVYDFGEVDSRYYLVMEFIDGQSFKDYLQRLALQSKRPTLEETHQILSQVAAALDYAHQRGIVHRDVKPDNVLITKDGRAVLNDFGIAKLLAEGSGMTQTGAAIGTPAYMSPEQIEGDKTLIGPTSDIYSLGIILFEIATGKPPFTADTPMAVMMKHLRDPIPIPRQLNPNVPEPLERVIFKALAKSPSDRYQSAGDFAKALETAIHAPSSSRMESDTNLNGTAIPQPTPAAGAIQSPAIVDALATGVTGATVPPAPPQQRATMRWVAAAIILILVLVVGGGSFLLLAGNDDKDDPKTETTKGPTDIPLRYAEAATQTRSAEDQATALAGVTAVAMAPQPTAPPAPTATLPIPTLEDGINAMPPVASEDNEPIGASEAPTSSVSSSSVGVTSGGETSDTGDSPVSEPPATMVVMEAPPNATFEPSTAASIPQGLLAPETVTAITGLANYAKMALDGAGNVHIVWWDNHESSHGYFYHRMRTPDGTWSEVFNLSEDKDIHSLTLQVATQPDGTVCAFWEEVTTRSVAQQRCFIEGAWAPIEDLFTARGRDYQFMYDSAGTLHTVSILNGAVSFDETPLSDGEGTVFGPIGAAKGDTVYVVWDNLDTDTLQMRSSSDAGATWTELEDIVPNDGSTPIALAIDSQDRLHVVWSYSGSPYYIVSTPEGWSERVKLNGGVGNSGSTSISMALDADDHAHVVWQGDELNYAYQGEDGTWQPAISLIDHSNSGSGPTIAIAPDGTRHVMWPNDSDNDDIFYSPIGEDAPTDSDAQTDAATPVEDAPVPTLTIIENNATFLAGLGETVNLTESESESDLAQIALDGEGNLHLVWWERDADGRGNFFHRLMTTDGVWSEDENLAEEQPIFNLSLDLATRPDGTVCVFWTAVTTIWDNQQRCYVEGAWTAAESLSTASDLRQYVFDGQGNRHELYLRYGSNVYVDDTQVSADQMAFAPVFVAKGDTLAVAWKDVNTLRLNARISTDAGATWGEIETVVERNGGTPIALAFDSQDRLHLVFSGEGHPTYVLRDAEGWSDPLDVLGGASNSGSTSIGLALDANDRPHIVWQGYEMNYTYQRADGTWLPSVRLAAVQNSGLGPELVIDAEGTRHLIWPDDDQHDIFYATISEGAADGE